MSCVAIEPRLIEVPAGSFLMGSNSGADDEKPVHEVRLDAFLLGTVPITNHEFKIFAGETAHPGLPFADNLNLNHPDQPAVGVSWIDAVAYCNWLSNIAGGAYRLPTEAEWEYAARSGSENNIYPWGNRSWQELPELHSRFDSGPVKAGSSQANSWGLYEMGMNVHEWCSDWYGANYYAVSPTANPQGPRDGTRRASRGGSWRHMIKITRCSARSSIPPMMQYADYGFRLVKIQKSE